MREAVSERAEEARHGLDPVSKPRRSSDRGRGPHEPRPNALEHRTADPAMRAVKRHCLECVGGSRAEVQSCLACAANAAVCELHRFLNRGRQGRYWRGALAAIRRECLTCMGVPKGGNADDVANCKSRTCALWPFRFGVRPQTAGRRGLDVEL